jgi:hypothetical protein
MRARQLNAVNLTAMLGSGLIFATLQYAPHARFHSTVSLDLLPAASETDSVSHNQVVWDRIVIDIAPPAAQLQNRPPLSAEGKRVASALAQQRLYDALTDEMLHHFKLFLYVSKADHGPLAQRMFVFDRQKHDALRLLYEWPVSTGREKTEANPAGRILSTFTPAGYYQLDRKRFYRHYRSVQWGEPMPYAMFFNWVERGRATGLAIHGVEGTDVARLGTRASAGCVRLAPQNARILFDLIRNKYKGAVPNFAFQRRSRTMMNNGELMRDAHGAPILTRGYKVLVLIENSGGGGSTAAML